MNTNNKLFNFIELAFDPNSKYHNKTNDLMIKYIIHSTKQKDIEFSVSAVNYQKKLAGDPTKYSAVLDQHYVFYGMPYQIIDSNAFTIMFIKGLEAGISIDDSFVRSILDDNVDYMLQIEQRPKDSSVIELRNALEMLQMHERSLEEELKTSKRENPRLIKEQEDTLKQISLVKAHLDVLLNTHFANMAKVTIGFKIPYVKSDPTSIRNRYTSFMSKIRQMGHSIQGFYGRQQFLMFDYVNGTNLPLYKYYVGIDNISIGALQPFIYANFVPNNEIILGNYATNNIPITGDIWNLPNQNGIIIGISGSGKSATSKSITTRNFIMKNRRIFIIDPQREYLYACKVVGGEYIDVLASSKNEAMSINIFDRANYETEATNAFDLKINDIITFLSFATASTSTVESGEVVERPLENNPIYYQFTAMVIKSFYAKYGILSLEDLNTHEPPTLDDFIKYINGLKYEIEKNNVINLENRKIESTDINYQNYLEAFKLISNACDILSSDEYAIFKGKTKINLESKYIVFNTRDLSPRMNLLATYVIMNYVIKTMSSDILEQKILLVDEGWKLMSKLGADYIKVIAKTARKFNLGLIVTTQQIEDFDNEQGRALLENSSFMYIFKQKEITRNKDKLMTDFGLTEEDIMFLKMAGPGEGILKFGNAKYRIRYLLTKEELKFAESNITKLKEIIPAEIISTKKKINELTNIITNKESLNLDVSYENKLLEYYRTMMDALDDIKKHLEAEAGSLGINEENIEDFVLEDRGIYNLNLDGQELFGPGIGIDEIKYLTSNGYFPYTVKDELAKLFPNETFYVKTIVRPVEIFIYSNYLRNLIMKKYSNFVVGNPIIERDILLLQVKTTKEIGKYYVYYPKKDVAQIMEIKGKDVYVSQAPKKLDYFKDDVINQNSVYIYDMINNKKMVFLESQFDMAKEKILYDTKRVYIRIAYDYFLPFSNEDMLFEEGASFYYVILTDKLFNTFIGPNGVVPKQYFRYDQSNELLKTIFGQ